MYYLLIQGRNRSLGNSIHEMSDFISTMEAREQELLSVLKLKVGLHSYK